MNNSHYADEKAETTEFKGRLWRRNCEYFSGKSVARRR
jgi:hypothetical protein